MPRTIGSITVYDLPEIAQKLRLHLDTLRRYVREGRLRATKIGKTYLVAEENLKEFLTGKTIQEMLTDLDLRKNQRRKISIARKRERRLSDRRRENMFHTQSL